MRLFSPVYARAPQWARHRHVPVYLGTMSFAESSFFPVPPDVMLAPMCLVKHDRAWRFALLTTLTSVAGKSFGKVGGAAAGMAFSFATTYALGQLAKRYYAGGRRMVKALLRDTFQNLLGPAKQMQTQYLPQIRQQAETLDMGRVMAMVRGG